MDNAANAVWVLLSAGLVLLMTPALGFFYGGLVRQKNVLSTIMYSFFTLALVSVIWVLVGHSLSFAPSLGGIIGGLDHVGLAGVNASLPATDGGKSMLFMLFQLTFAAITPALISGAFVERKRFGAFVAFTVLWTLLVYAPVAHWVWGGGWLSKLTLAGGSGVLDFAGGNVVHITSGFSALVCALLIGRRSGFGKESMQPHNATLTVLGAALLWFGWIGFNGGSALGMNPQAITAVVNTNTAAAAAAIAWLSLSWIVHRRPSVIGAAVGAVAGLVAITPGAGYVTPMSALLIGALTSVACFFITEFVVKGRVDDSLDVFGVHGVGGVCGGILTAVFASAAVPGNTVNGALAGNFGLLVRQIVSIVVVAAYAALMTAVILKVLGAFTRVRVSEEHELAGLDLSIHGEAIELIDRRQPAEV